MQRQKKLWNFLSYQLCRPPGPHGPHMYGQRMAMDPRFAYLSHMPRHGDPNYNRLPHNFNIQVYIHNYILFGGR